MFLRLPVATVVLAVALSACSSGGSAVPDRQQVKPAKAPDGWTTSTLDGVTLATPATWQKGETTQATATLRSTPWRAPMVDGASPAGVEVRVISKPQQNAEKNAMALAISAMAQLQGGRIDPVEISWPNAEKSYYLAYEAIYGATEKKRSYVNRTVVHDLADGRQIQVSSLVEKGLEESIPDRVLSTVQLPKA